MLPLDHMLESMKFTRWAGDSACDFANPYEPYRPVISYIIHPKVKIKNEELEKTATQNNLQHQHAGLVYLIGKEGGICTSSRILRCSEIIAGVSTDAVDYFLNDLLLKEFLDKTGEDEYSLTKKGNELYNKINNSIQERTKH